MGNPGFGVPCTVRLTGMECLARIWGGYVGNPGFRVPCTVRLTGMYIHEH